MKAVVVKEFRDITDFSKLYEVGADVSHFDEDRLKKCASLGLVKLEDEAGIGQEPGNGLVSANKGIITISGKEFEKAQVIEALKGIEVKVAHNIKDENLVTKLGELSEEDMAKLQTALGVIGDPKKDIINVAGKEFEKTLVLTALKNINVEVADEIENDALIAVINELSEEQGESLTKELDIEAE